MKKYSSLKIFSGKVVSAVLAASMLVGNVGAMPFSISSLENCNLEAEIDRYKAEREPILREAVKFRNESDPINRQIGLTLYASIAMDKICEEAEKRKVDPAYVKGAIELFEKAFQNDSYFQQVKTFSKNHPYEFELVFES